MCFHILNSAIFDSKIHRVKEQGVHFYDIVLQKARGNTIFEIIIFLQTNIRKKIHVDGKFYNIVWDYNFNVVPGVTSYMNSGNFISTKNADFLLGFGLKNLIYQGHGFGLSVPFISLIQSYEYVQQISNDYLYREKRLSANTVCTVESWNEMGRKV